MDTFPEVLLPGLTLKHVVAYGYLAPSLLGVPAFKAPKAKEGPACMDIPDRVKIKGKL